MSTTRNRRIVESEIEEHIPALRRYAQKLTRNPDNAADIVQMCLERALRNLHMFETGTNLRGWLFAILHNEFISEIRRMKRRGCVVPLEDWLDPGVSGGQEETVELGELSRAYSTLAPMEREILRRVCMEGESYASVGTNMILKVGTVKSRVFRAREKLHRIMERLPARSAG